MEKKLNGLPLRQYGPYARFVRYGLWGCYSLLLLLFCASCSDGLSGNASPLNGGDPTVKLALSYTGMNTQGGYSRAVADGTELFTEAFPGPSTRSVNETEITSLCVFQFSGSPGTDGTLLKQVYVDGFSATGGSTVEFSSVPSAACFFCVCANAGNLTTGFTENSSTYANLAAAALAVAGQGDFSSRLPMSGVSAAINTATQVNDIPVSLSPLVAKVTFTCDLSAFPSGSAFAITGASLRNIPASIPYMAPVSGVTTGAATASYTGTGTPDAGAQTTTYVWYVPENLRGAGTTVTPWKQRIAANAPAYATYIELTGTYTPDVSSPGTTSTATYTLYLGDGTDVNNYDVARNHHYIVTSRIKGIDVNDPRMVIN